MPVSQAIRDMMHYIHSLCGIIGYYYHKTSYLIKEDDVVEKVLMNDDIVSNINDFNTRHPLLQLNSNIHYCSRRLSYLESS